MDDAALVCFLERLGDLLRDGHDLVHGDRAALQSLREVFAFDQLEDERDRALDFFEAVDRRDVGMVVDRNVAAEFRVPCAKHLTHPARADGGDDFIRSEPRS